MIERLSAARTLRRIARRFVRRDLNYTQTHIVHLFGRRRRIGTPAAGAIDEVFPVVGEPRLINRTRSTDVVAGEPLYLRGWAIDQTRRTLGWDIRLEIDGNAVEAEVRRGQPRPDIVRAFGSPEVLACGFEAVVSTRGLSVGPHELSVRVTVGRRGAAFATLPVGTRFYVHDVYRSGLSPLSQRAAARPDHQLDPILPAAFGTVLEVSGWAIDRQHRFFAAIAGRIDAGAWHAGWTGIDRPGLAARAGRHRFRLGGFGLRIPLTGFPPGAHTVEVAGRSAAGQWTAIDTQPILVTAAETSLPPYLRRLADGGEATITRIDAEERPGVRTYRTMAGTAVLLAGTLRRSSPAGAPLAIIAERADGCAIRFHAWSAPAADPTQTLFGATLARDALDPGSYRLAVEAPDRSGRFIGRADTHCTLHVDVDPDTTASASGIARITASSTISTS
jgi:hypothetical protein